MADRLLSALTPRPHISFLLDVDAEAAKARMGEGRESVAYLRRLRELHLEQAHRTGAIVLDAARPLAELSDEVIYRTLTRYFDRYRTLINGLFLANPSRALSSRLEDGTGHD